jgi:oligopeptide/dipeptide ABC transporter ATP-binding protein
MTAAETEQGKGPAAAANAPAMHFDDVDKPLLLDVHDLRVRFTYRGRIIRAVNGVNFSVAPGETLAVIGESGSGKTVTSRALMGLLPASARVHGSVRFEGRELLGLSERELRDVRGREISMVFQDPARSLNPTLRVGHQLREAVLVHNKISKVQAKERSIELLRMVRLPAPETRYSEYPHQLSGGMRQRVMIAIALACRPKLLIADEATTALDVTTQAQIMEMLLELQQQMGMALVLISHDMGLAASYTSEVLVMYAGRVVEGASTEQLFNHVRMPYTKVLLDAIPRVDRPSHSLLPVVPGRPPDLDSLTDNCAFHPRCPRVQGRCTTERPALVEHEPGHRYACFFPFSATETS